MPVHAHQEAARVRGDGLDEQRRAQAADHPGSTLGVGGSDPPRDEGAAESQHPHRHADHRELQRARGGEPGLEGRGAVPLAVERAEVGHERKAQRGAEPCRVEREPVGDGVEHDLPRPQDPPHDDRHRSRRDPRGGHQRDALHPEGVELANRVAVHVGGTNGRRRLAGEAPDREEAELEDVGHEQDDGEPDEPRAGPSRQRQVGHRGLDHGQEDSRAVHDVMALHPHEIGGEDGAAELHEEVRAEQERQEPHLRHRRRVDVEQAMRGEKQDVGGKESEEAGGGEHGERGADHPVHRLAVVLRGGSGDEADERGADAQLQDGEVAEDAEEDLPDAVAAVAQLADDDRAQDEGDDEVDAEEHGARQPSS